MTLFAPITASLPLPFSIDFESQLSLIRVMNAYIVSRAKPELAALVPAPPTHDVTAELDIQAVNRRLAESEKTPTAPWTSGDASRLAKQVLRKRATR